MKYRKGLIITKYVKNAFNYIYLILTDSALLSLNLSYPACVFSMYL